MSVYYESLDPNQARYADKEQYKRCHQLVAHVPRWKYVLMTETRFCPFLLLKPDIDNVN